jgi:hypothetical protein
MAVVHRRRREYAGWVGDVKALRAVGVVAGIYLMPEKKDSQEILRGSEAVVGGVRCRRHS